MYTSQEQAQREEQAKLVMKEALDKVEKLGFMTKVTCSPYPNNKESYHQAFFWIIPTRTK